jgi:predicted NUDIX family phosphoesterase
MAQEEHVLVIERKVLENVGMFQGLTFDVDKYIDSIFTAGVPRYMPRSQAEEDPNYKQIIPYVIMTHNEKYLSYVRGKRAGEKRLVGNRSIGIGGHINPTDDMPLFCSDFRESYLGAVQREVEEEVCVETDYTNQVVALINDDSNEVGRVHLGIVHCWHLNSPKVRKKEQMITQMSFVSSTELQSVRESLETWSSLCLDGLADMMKIKGTGIQTNALSG